MIKGEKHAGVYIGSFNELGLALLTPYPYSRWLEFSHMATPNGKEARKPHLTPRG